MEEEATIIKISKLKKKSKCAKGLSNAFDIMEQIPQGNHHKGVFSRFLRVSLWCGSMCGVYTHTTTNRPRGGAGRGLTELSAFTEINPTSHFWPQGCPLPPAVPQDQEHSRQSNSRDSVEPTWTPSSSSSWGHSRSQEGGLSGVESDSKAFFS